MRDPTAEVDFRALLEAMPGLHLIVLPDAPRYTIVAASDAYLSGTLTTRATAIGRGIFELFPDNPDDPLADGVRRLRASLDLVRTTATGHTMPVQKYDIQDPADRGAGFSVRYWSPRNVPVLGPGEGVRWIIHTVEDVTAFVTLQQQNAEIGQSQADLRGHTVHMEQEILRRQAEIAEANDRLREANTRLSQLDAAKTAFFSNVSHELRTPLTLILASVDGTLAPGAPGPDAVALGAIERSARRLLHLVNQILEFSRMEVGETAVRLEPTDLAVCTRALVAPFAPLAARCGLSLHVDCAPDDAVLVDRRLWETIVLNLVANALKYTPAGSVRVRLRPIDADLRLEVEDTGPGIPASDVDRVFKRFHRVEGVAGRVHGGTGLGLALVRHAAELLGGTVTLETREGVGSTFGVRLPRRTTAAGPTPAAAYRLDDYIHDVEAWPGLPGAAPPAPAPSPDAGAERVLIVDDHPDMRALLRRLLAPYWTVIEAVDGVDAREVMREAVPDLIVSDVMMPRLDGFGLLRAVRATPATATTPVLLLSARADEDGLVEGIDTGADDYVTKPFSPRELVARVRTQLHLAQERKRANAATQALADARAALLADLARKNRELEAFSNSVSHDLRAPIRSIDGFARALEEDHAEGLGSEGLGHVARIRAAAHRMGRLVDDLLRLARWERGAFRPTTVDFTALALAMAQHLQDRAPARTVTVEVDPGMKVWGDGNLLEVALENLLTNAWKFTAGSTDPRIHVGTTVADGERRWFVRDNGVGFDPRCASRLFQAFSRLHEESTFPGVGIGLVTVRRIIERHDGRIWAEAEPGRGATFWWTLGTSEATR